MMEAQSVQDDSGAGWQTQLRAKKSSSVWMTALCKCALHLLGAWSPIRTDKQRIFFLPLLLTMTKGTQVAEVVGGTGSVCSRCDKRPYLANLKLRCSSKISVAEKWAVGHCYHISLHETLLIHLCQHCLTGIRQNPLKLALLMAKVCLIWSNLQ